MLYENIYINGREWRRVVESDNPKDIGKYRCECGGYIKNELKMEGHLKTPSHFKALEWKRRFKESLPTGRLLLGYPIYQK